MSTASTVNVRGRPSTRLRFSTGRCQPVADLSLAVENLSMVDVDQYYSSLQKWMSCEIHSQWNETKSLSVQFYLRIYDFKKNLSLSYVGPKKTLKLFSVQEQILLKEPITKLVRCLMYCYKAWKLVHNKWPNLKVGPVKTFNFHNKITHNVAILWNVIY